jgi:hypothetical protein
MASIFSNKLIFFIIFFAFFNLTKIVAQTGFYVSRGPSVQFFFNTSSKLSNGIEYIDFIEIRVYNDGTRPAPEGANWEIVASLEAPFDNLMPGEVVELEATDPGIPGIFVDAPKQLSATPERIISSTITGSNIPINITIRVGTNAGFRVSGYDFGYYPNSIRLHINFYP